MRVPCLSCVDCISGSAVGKAMLFFTEEMQLIGKQVMEFEVTIFRPCLNDETLRLTANKDLYNERIRPTTPKHTNLYITGNEMFCLLI